MKPASRESAVQLVELERAQIAHEIHDALLPLIFAASVGVERLLDDAANSPGSRLEPARAERLKQIHGWLGEAMAAGRDLLARTHPAELADQSWQVAAADSLARQFESLDVNWDIEPSLRELDRDRATAAYRIVVEAVRNAVRHGGASAVAITASRTDDRALIEVRDQGSGFDPDEVEPNRFGIRSMRGRAALVGGQLEIRSAPGGPTSVRFSFPL